MSKILCDKQAIITTSVLCSLVITILGTVPNESLSLVLCHGTWNLFLVTICMPNLDSCYVMMSLPNKLCHLSIKFARIPCSVPID